VLVPSSLRKFVAIDASADTARLASLDSAVESTVSYDVARLASLEIDVESTVSYDVARLASADTNVLNEAPTDASAEAALRAAFKGLASIDNYNISVGRSYAALRKVESKATDAAGEAIFYLSGSTYTAFKKNTAAGGQPPNGFIDSIGDVAVDVMVLNDDNSYTNDLVSIKVEEHNSVWVKVTVSAPAHANKNVRLIAINEKVNENTLFDL